MHSLLGFVKQNKLSKLIILVLIFLMFRSQLYTKILNLTHKSSRIISNNRLYYEFKSHCPCREETIRLVKFDDESYTVTKILENYESVMYTVSIKEFEKSTFTCDMFNTLRRGKGQKVHSYSLFGERKGFYYDKFVNNSKNLHSLYPGWLMRVSHDDTIDKSVICDVECAKDDNGNYLDNVDFCDVTKMPENGLNKSNEWSAFYMHPMKYRWLSSGDSFVDVTTSRDSDGFLVEREVHAVKEWFDSGKYGHIMRGIISKNQNLKFMLHFIQKVCEMDLNSGRIKFISSNRVEVNV